MIKLVATDIDGTILGYSKEFTPAVINCVKQLGQKGVKVVLVTGRMHAATKQIAEKLGLETPLVSYQGGLIKKNYYSDEIIYQSCLPKEDVKNILLWAKNKNIHINLYCNDILYVEKDNSTIKTYANYQHINYKVCPFEKVGYENINKVLAIDYHNEDIVTNWVLEMQNKMPHLYIIKSCPFFCEFSTFDATKGKAVNELKKYWNLKDNEILTIGDQDNDIELLKAGGISVAMGNATENLKQYADYITDTVDNDGFVKAMEELVLGELYV